MLTLALTTAALAAACPPTPLPATFSITERAFTWTTAFDVSSGGSVTGDMWAWAPSFTYTDASGNIGATAKKTSYPWGVHIDVYDCNNVLVGSVQEKTFSYFSGYQTLYAILDANGKEVATSGKFGWFDTNFAINDPAGHPVASLDRPRVFVGGDTWNVQVSQPGIIDERVLIMTAAFKTEADSHGP